MDTTESKTPAGIRILMAISGIFMIILGAFLFFTPRYIVWAFLAAVAFRGVALIVKYFASKESRNGWDIVNGILLLIFGFWMITGNIETRAVALVAMETFIAVWMVVSGIGNIITAFIPKKRGEKSWVWFILGGILSVICGIALFAFPIYGTVMTVAIIGIFTGIIMIVNGFTAIAAAFTKAPPQEETP